jgi:hypothetical protein
MAAVEKFKAPELNPAEAGAHGTTVININYVKLEFANLFLLSFFHRSLRRFKKNLKKRLMMLMLKRRTLTLS